ncbi:MAG: serpin family protein [Firmicutes bacterium]|nr:serpin family protein [Bacillota bacterium]HPU00802.1 serpin family protein [Bacillota bacterium]
MSFRRRSSLTLLFLAVAIPLLLGGCQVMEHLGFHPKEVAAEPASHVDERLVEGSRAFGFNVFRALFEKNPRGNIFISPASISMALAMTANGAAGETFQAMMETLQLQGMALPDLNGAFADLKSILENPDPKVELAIANSLWSRQGVSFNEDFLQRNRDYFDAEIRELDFNLPQSVKTINEWVREQTRGKIEKIIDGPIDSLTVLFLINAIYFHGSWSQEFKPNMTREIPFELPDGETKYHPVMFQEDRYRYFRGEGFEAVSLPYGKNKRISMDIYLPARESSLAVFLEKLTPDNWADWQFSFREMEGEIGLPRFKFEYEASLKEILERLGMGPAFDPQRADFSGMRPVPPELYISEVKHKTYIDVNEKGTEAAAVTSVEVRVTSLQPEPERFRMVVDRPFFFTITDNKTGAILFMGAVNNP